MIYRVIVYEKDEMNHLLTELSSWGVQEKHYEMEVGGQSFLTINSNVVDVVSESLSRQSYCVRQVKPFKDIKPGQSFYHHKKGFLSFAEMRKRKGYDHEGILIDGGKPQPFSYDVLVEVEL